MKQPKSPIEDTINSLSVETRSITSLHLHQAMHVIPEKNSQSRKELTRKIEQTKKLTTPLTILADGSVLSGKDEFEIASSIGLTEIPVIVAEVAERQVEMFVLDLALREPHFTDDQLKCMAVEYFKRVSKQLKAERAIKAATARHGNDPASRSTGAEKQDARTMACEKYGISEKGFRRAKKLFEADGELFAKVKNGHESLIDALQDQAKQAKHAAEVKRSADAKEITEFEEYVHGDGAEEVQKLRDKSITALLFDPPYGIDFQQEWRAEGTSEISGDQNLAEALKELDKALVAAVPKMLDDSFLFCSAPAKFEPEFRAVIENNGWRIIAYPVWVKNTMAVYSATHIGSQHERLIVAVRGNAQPRRAHGDVLKYVKTHATSHPCEKPVALLKELIELVTTEGELVVDLFAGTASTLVAGKQLNRRVFGVEKDIRWYEEGKIRLANLKTVQKIRVEKIASVENKIICADVLDGLALIPDESIDLIITSPPYNVSLDYANWNDNLPYQTYLKWLKKVFEEFKRVLRRGRRAAIIFDLPTNRESDSHQERIRPLNADIHIAMRDVGLGFFAEWAWNKSEVAGRKTAWGSWNSPSCPMIGRNHEHILVFSKETWKLEGDPILVDITPEEFLEWQRSSLFITPETRKLGDHPAPMPERLAEGLIKFLCRKRDHVLDPFAGTGTVPYIAAKLGRRYTGIDNAKTYCEFAEKRIHSLQLDKNNSSNDAAQGGNTSEAA